MNRQTDERVAPPQGPRDESRLAATAGTASAQMQIANSLTAALIQISIPIPILGNSHKLILRRLQAFMPCRVLARQRELGQPSRGKVALSAFILHFCSFLVNLQLSCQRKWKM